MITYIFDLSRRDQVLPTQLRSGHCRLLAAYHIGDYSVDPIWRKCVHVHICTLFRLLFLSIISTAYHLLSGFRAARLILN